MSKHIIIKEYALTFLEIYSLLTKRIKDMIEWNLLEKKCKTAILLYCFHTAGILHIFVLYNLSGPETSFYRKSKINIKR